MDEMWHYRQNGVHVFPETKTTTLG
jgi:hypothetical protein